MAAEDLLGKFKQRAGQSIVSAITGEPPAGSQADLERKIRMAELQRQYDNLRKDPNDGQATQKFLETLRTVQGLNQEGRRSENEITLDYVTDERFGRAANDKLDRRIKQDRASTENEISRLTAEAQQRMLGLDRITDHEYRLAGGSQTDTNRDVLAFLSEAHDKNLAAQAEARKPNILSLLAGIGTTAASLFA